MSQIEDVKPLSKVGPWDLVARGYSEVTAKLFGQYAEEALAMVGVDLESEVLDVACGPGTLALLAAPRVRRVHAVDFSASMIEQLRRAVDAEGIGNLEARCEDGQSLSCDDEQFDAAFSMFGLMFFPDRRKGHAEMLRALKQGGRTVVASWAPISDSSLMQVLFEALEAINPNITPPAADVESLEDLDFFAKEMEAARYEDVEVMQVDRQMHFATAEGFWTDLVRGSAPLALLKQNVPPDQWEAMSRTAVRTIRDRYGAGNLWFNATANFATGRKPLR